MLAWFNALDPKIQTMLIAVGTSVATVIAVKPLEFALSRWLDQRDKAKSQLRDRKNPELNIRKNTDLVRGHIGSHQMDEYWINPFWIEKNGDKAYAATLESYELVEMYSPLGPGIAKVPAAIPVQEDTLKRAREDKEWLVFQRWRKELTFKRFESSGLEDRYLFQPLPPKR